MHYDDAKKQFVQSWGTFGAAWGINKAMAQIHALLLISPRPLCTDEIMEELQISRGNANMTIRALLNWGIISKVIIPGERKEYFESEKDLWEMVKRVISERKKKELEPVAKMLEAVQAVSEGPEKEVAEFKRVTTELSSFSNKAVDLLDKILKAERYWFFGTFFKWLGGSK